MAYLPKENPWKESNEDDEKLKNETLKFKMI